MNSLGMELTYGGSVCCGCRCGGGCWFFGFFGWFGWLERFEWFCRVFTSTLLTQFLPSIDFILMPFPSTNDFRQRQLTQRVIRSVCEPQDGVPCISILKFQKKFLHLAKNKNLDLLQLSLTNLKKITFLCQLASADMKSPPSLCPYSTLAMDTGASKNAMLAMEDLIGCH